MQQFARRHSQRIIDENQKLRSELESKMQDLDLRSKQLDELAARSESDRRNLEHEKEKVGNVLFLLSNLSHTDLWDYVFSSLLLFQRFVNLYITVCLESLPLYFVLPSNIVI